MAVTLGAIILYNAPVVRVERQSTGFRVSYLQGAGVSIWAGWMEGALESGERAARDVLNATGPAWPEQTGPTR